MIGAERGARLTKPALAGLTGCGHYHEEYVREEGEWRIARTRLVRLRVDPLK